MNAHLDPVDPVALFGKLDAELRAASTLISLSTTEHETRAAAVEGLRLARDVLHDALSVLDVVDDEQRRQTDDEQLTRPYADVHLPDVELLRAGLADDGHPTGLSVDEVDQLLDERWACVCGSWHTSPAAELNHRDDELAAAGHATTGPHAEVDA